MLPVKVWETAAVGVASGTISRLRASIPEGDLKQAETVKKGYRRARLGTS